MTILILLHFFFNRTRPAWLFLLPVTLTCEMNAKVALSHRIVRRRGRNILAATPTSVAPDIAKKAGHSSRSSSPAKTGDAQGSSSTKKSRTSKSSLLSAGRAARRNFDSPASVADFPSYLLLARGASSSSNKRANEHMEEEEEEHKEASILLQRATLRREDERHRRVEESSRTSSYRNSRIGENRETRVHQPPTEDDSSRLSGGPPMVVPIKMRCVDRVVDRTLDGNTNNDKKLPNGGRKLVECGLREVCNKSALTAKQCFDDGFVAFNKAKTCCCWGDGATYLCDEQMTTSTSTSTMGGSRNVIEFELLQPKLLPGASSTSSSAASSGTGPGGTQAGSTIADVQRGRESTPSQSSGTTDGAENRNSTPAQAYYGDGMGVAPGQEQSHNENECPLWAIVVSACTLVLVASLGLYLAWEGMKEQMYLMGQQAEGEEDYLGSKNMNGKKNLQHLLLQPEPEPPPQPPLGLAVARGPREDHHLQGGNLLSSSSQDVLSSSGVPRANEITSGARPYSNDVSSGTTTSYLGSVQSARFGESYASSGLLHSQKSAAGFSGTGGASTSVFQDGSSIASLGAGTILSGGATTSPTRPAIPQLSNLPQTSGSSSSSSSSSVGRDSPRWIAARERAAAAAKAKAALRSAMSRPPVPEES
ncbi:unnamed protein product [Amoebophrya sp. A120]|nr:unnamed protein product [Amoebophrya sp. A120]|eukprot:GSA120T00017652001.1